MPSYTIQELYHDLRRGVPAVRVNGQPPATADLDVPHEVVASDENRAIALWQTSTDSTNDAAPGRRAGITNHFPDGQEMWRLTGDAGEVGFGELSLYGNDDDPGAGPSSYATRKFMNLVTTGGSGWETAFYLQNQFLITGQNAGGLRFKLRRNDDTSNIIFDWKDSTGASLYRQRMDPNGFWTLEDGTTPVMQLQGGDNRVRFPNQARFKPQTSAPSNPVDGDIAYADGTNWDPGSGAGFYGRESGAWVKL